MIYFIFSMKVSKNCEKYRYLLFDNKKLYVFILYTKLVKSNNFYKRIKNMTFSAFPIRHILPMEIVLKNRLKLSRTIQALRKNN
jgi:hypothetical protein